jgi:hypothetical protein
LHSASPKKASTTVEKKTTGFDKRQLVEVGGTDISGKNVIRPAENLMTVKQFLPHQEGLPPCDHSERLRPAEIDRDLQTIFITLRKLL